MKKKLLSKILTLSVLIFNFNIIVKAQIPQGINYQAVLRNPSGTIMANKNVTLKLTIHRSTPNGTTVYEETWQTTTNGYGLVNLQIGQGSPTVSSFSLIQWGKYSHFLQVSADIGSGPVNLGTTQFISVPYAMVADTVLHGGGGGDNWGTQSTIINSTLSGDGTNGNPLGIAQQGAKGGQILKWNGTTWAPANENAGGSVTSIATGTGLTGGPITSTGTISALNTTALWNANQIQGTNVSSNPPKNGQILQYNGTNWLPITLNYWGLTGNSGTNPTLNFIGTTDAQPLDFRTNNSLKLRLTKNGHIETYNTGGSVFIGNAAGTNDDLSNRQNIFIGDSAGFANTNGAYNIGIGNMSMRFTNGLVNNTACGYQTLMNNTGNDNTAFGFTALSTNAGATRNTAVGSRAMGYKNSSGSDNTSVGYLSNANNTTGNDNTAIGSNTLYKGGNTHTGNGNTAIGNHALLHNTSGDYNVAIGWGALAGPSVGNTTGSSNVAIGRWALKSNTTGSGNTGIGIMADVSSNNLTNATAIGNSAIVNASNKVRIGNTAVTIVEGQVSYTTSDGRFKKNIKDNVVGLNFIMGLKPVTYNFEYQKFSQFLGENGVDLIALKQRETQSEIGFIAQDVEAVCSKLGINVSNIVHVPQSDKDNYSIAYGEIVVPLVKGMQEQQAIIEELKKQMGILQLEVEKLKAAK